MTAQLGNEVNPSITIDNGNPSNMVVVAASETLGLVNPLVVSYSINRGKTWATNIIAAEDPLPVNTAYYVGLEAGQSGMIYTLDTSSNGTDGDSSFTDIQPTNYINLTFSVAATDNGSSASNYFAIEMGKDWFVSTNLLVGSAPPGSEFVYVSTPYTNLASAWDQLTINSAGVTIGPPATNDLSGLITGVGIAFELWTWRLELQPVSDCGQGQYCHHDQHLRGRLGFDSRGVFRHSEQCWLDGCQRNHQ